MKNEPFVIKFKIKKKKEFANELFNQDGPYKAKVEENKKAYKRKSKYPKNFNDEE